MSRSTVAGTVRAGSVMVAVLLLGLVLAAGDAGSAGASGTSAASTGSGSVASQPTSVPGDPISVQSVNRVDARVLDIEMTTPALAGPVENGDAEQITARRPVIGVFPEAASGGWYTDWYNNGAGGQPEWETFHVDQLVPWIDHNFRTVADRGGRALYLYSGNGNPGPLDTGSTATSFSEFRESVVFQATTYFVGEMRQLHIRGYVDLYGNGTHSWPYWQRDLRSALPMVMSDFAHPSFNPRTITYTTADPEYSKFGWTVSMHRDVEEFSTLSTVGSHELTLKGSGEAQVTTPANYHPGSAHRVVISSTSGRTISTVHADSSGHLVLNMNLGSSNQTTEYAPGWIGSDTKVFVTTAEIK